MITLKINTTKNQKLFFTDTNSLILKISKKILASINTCLTLVIIWLSQNTMMIQTK